MISKLTSLAAIAIATEPTWSRAIKVAKGELNSNDFTTQLTSLYTGFDRNTGQFSTNALIEGYAPIAGGIIFKKAVGYLLRHAKLKI